MISLVSFVFTGEEISLWLVLLFHLRHETFMFMKWFVAHGRKLRNNVNPRERNEPELQNRMQILRYKANLELRWITVRESKPYRIPRGDIEIKTTPVSPELRGLCHDFNHTLTCWKISLPLTWCNSDVSRASSKWKKNVCQVSLVRFVSCRKMSISILRKKKKNLNSISIVEELNNIFEPFKLWKYYIYFLEKCNQDIYLQKINLLCIFNILNIEIIKKLLHFKYNEIFLSFFSSDLDKCLIERFWYAYAINFII